MSSVYSTEQAIRHIPDYSQDHEQGHILKALAGVTKGRFLDIGAYHPTDLSNTRGLYELGWEGVLVEPSPAPMISLMKEYGRDSRITLLQALVAPGHEGGCRSMVVTDGPYSTIDPSNFSKWKNHVGYYAQVMIPIIPLKALLQMGPFDFIDIDVEGGSKDLFVGMLDLQVRPKCVCVEYDEHRAEIETRAKASNYSQIYINAVNVIFARND